MIGGSGERKTLRLVAKYADACNIFVNAPDEATHKLNVLRRRHCEDVGTDYERIRKTMLYMGGALMSGDTDAFVRDMAGFAAVGIEGVSVMPMGPDPIALSEHLDSDVVPVSASSRRRRIRSSFRFPPDAACTNHHSMDLHCLGAGATARVECFGRPRSTP